MTKAELIYAITGDVERYLQAIKDDKSNHSPDIGKMAEHIREDTKMIEPTDNTKIEELELGDKYYTVQEIIGKLNEVIRKLNREG